MANLGVKVHRFSFQTKTSSEQREEATFQKERIVTTAIKRGVFRWTFERGSLNFLDSEL